MKVYFNTREEWLEGIAHAVQAGLKFEAFDASFQNGCYTIEYTGGY